MIVNTYSVAQDSSFGNSLVYDLSAIDSSWNLIVAMSSTDNYQISDFNNYNQLLFYIPAGSNYGSYAVEFKNNLNAVIFSLSGSINLPIAVMINKSMIPTNVLTYRATKEGTCIYGK